MLGLEGIIWGNRGEGKEDEGCMGCEHHLFTYSRNVVLNKRLNFVGQSNSVAYMFVKKEKSGKCQEEIFMKM